MKTVEEKATEEAKKQAYEFSTGDYENGYIEGHAEAMRWIPIAKLEIPIEEEKVFVFIVDNEDCEEIEYCFCIYKGDGYWQVDQEFKKTVYLKNHFTHWKPI